MVAWIVNDLSLAGQFGTAEEFCGSFEKILALGQSKSFKDAGHSLSCASPHLGHRPVAADDTCMAEAIHAMPVRDLRSIALRWLTKGPFWSAPPEGRGVVYQLVEDVTEQGLGEAARRRWLGEDARTFSFAGVPQFEQTPLEVECLREGVEEGELTSVPNDWDILALERAAPVAKQPAGWDAMLDEACATFKGLEIARLQILKEMSAYPYGKGARDRLFEVLKYLNEYAEVRIAFGDGSVQVSRWMNTYVFSKCAVFSSQDFAKKNMATFNDPTTGKGVFCPWHGKIHNPIQYRIHYEYPVPNGQKLLKVLYIGGHR